MNYGLALTLQEIKQYIGDSKLIALDIETAPLSEFRDDPKAPFDAHKSAITGISFSVSEGTGIYVPLRHKNGDNTEFSGFWEWLKNSILENKNMTVVIHNAAFESMFFYALGCVPQCKIYDTMAAAQLTLKTDAEFRNLGDSGLKTLVPELIGIELPSFESVTQGAFFDELDPQTPETIRYACSDADFALRLYHIFNNWFDENMTKHRFIVEEIESKTAVYTGLMKYNGVPVDVDLMKEKGIEAEAQIAQLKEDIAIMTDGVDIGANASTKAFKEYLYRNLGLPVLKNTEKMKQAVDDEALILLSEWCAKNKPELVPLFQMIQEYRRWNKLKSTYIDGYLKHVNTATNRIHADLMPLATETGRFASRNPNLQNCCRKDNDPIGVRNFIVAPEGKTLMSLDFSQIELRVGAFYCRDKAMLETYKNGGDIHAQTTSVIYKIPFEEALDKTAPYYKERRTIAKACNFGVFFGLFPKGLQRNLKFKAGLNKTIDECDEIIRNLKSGYPALEIWQGKIKHEASNSMYTETFLGRRRYLPNINFQDRSKHSFAQRCALNTPIQGTAADILKLALIRILAGLPERLWLRPILQIHDELVFEIPLEKVNEAVKFVKKCMERRPFDAFDIPIIAEASVGKKFGQMIEMEV